MAIKGLWFNSVKNWENTQIHTSDEYIWPLKWTNDLPALLIWIFRDFTKCQVDITLTIFI